MRYHAARFGLNVGKPGFRADAGLLLRIHFSSPKPLDYPPFIQEDGEASQLF